MYFSNRCTKSNKIKLVCISFNNDSNHLRDTVFSISVVIEHMNSWLPRCHNGKESTCQFRRCKTCRFHPWVRKISWSRKRQPIPVFLPGKHHGQRSLAGYSPWGCKESDTTWQLNHHHHQNLRNESAHSSSSSNRSNSRNFKN